MKYIVKIIEAFQRRIDVDRIQVFGMGLDRYAHFSVVFILSFVLFYFRRPRFVILISLGIIILKEILDFIPLIYYNDIRSEHLLDSGIDIGVGILALYSSFKVHWFCEKKNLYRKRN